MFGVYIVDILRIGFEAAFSVRILLLWLIQVFVRYNEVLVAMRTERVCCIDVWNACVLKVKDRSV
jgi:hypothetical protein